MIILSIIMMRQGKMNYIKTSFVMILLLILLISPGYAEQDKIPVIIVFNDNFQGNGLAHAQNDRADIIHQNGGEIEHNYHVINGVSATLPKNAIDALSKNKDILYIEPDIEVQAFGQTIPWGVERVNAPMVHPVNKGTGIKIAVIDSGIDYTHPDLNANYKGGYDFVNSDNDPMDDYGHGTKAAGVIAAEDNNVGIVGVAPESSIYGVKVLSSSGSGRVSTVVKGIEWAIDNDMDIISMSLGSTMGSLSFRSAVDHAYNSGIIVVASAGNYGSSSTDSVAYPAKYDSVIAVSAIDQNDRITAFSSVGPAVELTGPGLGTTTTILGGNYGRFSGTSASAPHASGIAACNTYTVTNRW